MKKVFLIICFLFIMVSFAQAEVVVLKNGQTLKGKITARTTQFIRIDIGIDVDLTYYLDQIESIDGVFIKIKDDFVTLDPLEDINENEETSVVDIDDGSNKLINNLDTQKLPEKLNLPEGKKVNPFESEPEPSYREEEDQMDEFQKFQRLHFFNEFLDFFMKSLETSAFPHIIIGVTTAIFLALWIVSCLPLIMIAKTLGLTHRWMGWVPFLQVFLFIRMANVPLWWIILFFIPVVNFFIPLILWFKIAEALGRPTWLAFLMYMPVINFVVLWYFAFSQKPAEKTFVV